jgi:hypothetical protein
VDLIVVLQLIRMVEHGLGVVMLMVLKTKNIVKELQE